MSPTMLLEVQRYYYYAGGMTESPGWSGTTYNNTKRCSLTQNGWANVTVCVNQWVIWHRTMSVVAKRDSWATRPKTRRPGRKSNVTFWELT